MELLTKYEFGAFEARMRKMFSDLKADLQEALVEKKDFYTIKDFAEKTGQKYTTVRMQCSRGKLKAFQDQVGGTWLIDACELQRLREEAARNEGRY